ncbi:unnamed protein product (macronuclear) [Paramecium tetraurelia]|uniref:EamA domain-containing protein n=1 Tax=Paramecium tetraurelia TaxID=5888 RepID=A0BXI8_PARTE|nr:uncharacterized protein GSPATT00033108001 [Paramecium tetraurelia]CAK63255.1 unnamed protein product [Paramecium tetraurelia]|eukprot:XP_001430653.1 hypothetical protein (macronuclear) [Paramecium tetraurelia strain d4-2]
MQIQTTAIVKQVVSSLFAAVASMLLKMVSDLDFNQTLYLRALIGLTLLASATIYYKLQVYNFDKPTMDSLINRGLIGGFGAFIYFKGLNLVLVSESILLNRMSPFWTSIIYILVLKKEQFNIRLIINMTMSCLGIFLIAKNNNQTQLAVDSYYHWIGIFLILVASITQAIVNILVKSVNKQVDSIVITLYQAFFAINLPVINSLFDGTNFKIPSVNGTSMIAIASVISLLAGILQVQSMREGKLSVVSNVSQIQLFFGYLIDFFVFSAKFNTEQIIGNVLLLCSLIPLIWK